MWGGGAGFGAVRFEAVCGWWLVGRVWGVWMVLVAPLLRPWLWGRRLVVSGRRPRTPDTPCPFDIAAPPSPTPL